ncbi:MAG: CehA/McbA family metallohydrolase [Bryobacteraceae bacterium]|nr:CehA/McbA family metallohydrolase [Bryobacteraceae bacterium]
MKRSTLLRASLAGAFLIALVVALSGQGEQVIAIEIGKHNTDLLPKGKEADGILGDFVLRNDKIHALVSGNQPGRRANMSTEYGFPTQGALYDLDLRGADNDQLTAFRPGDHGGNLSWVRVASDGSDGSARVEAVRTAAMGDGLHVRLEYRLDRGWRHLLLTYSYRNETRDPVKIAPLPVWKGFSREWTVGDIQVADAIDPFDKRGYAWTTDAGAPPIEKEFMLPAGQERTYRVVIAPADSPAAAYGVIAGLAKPSGAIAVAAKDKQGAPAVHAALELSVEGETLPAYPDRAGRVEFAFPAGAYPAKLVDIGRDPVDRQVAVAKGQTAKLEFALEPAAAVRFNVHDEQGQPLPCKVQFLGRDGTPTPNFGTDYRAKGGNHQYQSHNGQFTQQVPPGKYLVRITRGPEYDMVEQPVEVGKGRQVDVSATLIRTVNSTGWVATDFHAHSTPSGDNYCSTDDRIANFAAEHLEFIPTTEHNRLYDWNPHISKLGLDRHLKTIVGIELTGRGQHFNSFPLQVVPFAQDGGAPQWVFDPRINAIVLRNLFEGGPDRWVQANHPIVSQVFNDRNQDGVADGGFAGFERLVDAAEVWSTEILNLNPYYLYTYEDQEREVENRTFGWLQMLNQGRHVWCVAVSDSHRIFGNGAGSWRTYVPSSTDEPSQIDYKEIVRNSKAGRMMITNGPFLEVRTADGLPIGSSIVSAGPVSLKVKVQTPNWMDVDRVQILVNGRQRPQDNYTRASRPKMFRNDGSVRFDETLTVSLQEDAHLIVVATGEHSDLSKGWGLSWESKMHPLAYTNPIYVDLDGKGFRPNGDTLGHPILVSKR